MDIEAKKAKILASLAEVSDVEARYRLIIEMGRAMPPIPEGLRLEKFLIQGCMSQAWLVPEFKNGCLNFYADSDAAIVKGIMAILLSVYSGNQPKQNLLLSPEFLKDGGVTEHLSLNRRNGLSSVVKQIMLYSQAFVALNPSLSD